MAAAHGQLRASLGDGPSAPLTCHLLAWQPFCSSSSPLLQEARAESSEPDLASPELLEQGCAQELPAALGGSAASSLQDRGWFLMYLHSCV